MKRIVFGFLLLTFIGVAGAAAQDFGARDQELVGEGWKGFADVEVLWHFSLTLVLASVLGAVIAYHPRTQKTVDTVEEAEAPKIYVTYSVIGAIIGLMVLQYGLVVGFVVFGIGGLIRFRTDLPSATKTGRLILVTLIGLSLGLDLPHLALLATAFGFGLIYVLDARITYRIDVKRLKNDQIAEAAAAYAAALEQQQFRILSEKRSFSKGRVSFVFQTSPRVSRNDLEAAFERLVPEQMRGTVDWEVA
ncbi:MAG: hypothetical protein WED81_05050 [Rhodothermales bacterium]